MPTSTVNAPPGNTPVAVLYRYTAGKQSWKTWLGGPDVHPKDGVRRPNFLTFFFHSCLVCQLSMSPDLNGDLAYSEKSGLYGAYFVVTGILSLLLLTRLPY
jgi:hypothetical protein